MSKKHTPSFPRSCVGTQTETNPSQGMDSHAGAWEPETVPSLRFPEFRDTGEWEKKLLGSICSSISSGKDKNDTSGVYDLYGSTGIIGKTSNDTFTGDFILSARVGANAGLLTRASGKFGVTDNTLVIILKKTEEIDFIYYFLDSIELNKMVFGSGQPLITGKQLKNLGINLPIPKEQQKIANCLSSIDDLITAQAQKTEALKAHKKGLMQQLFPREGETVPGIRFPEFRDAGEWEEAKLGDKEISKFIKDRIPLSQLDIENYISTENLLPDYAGVKTATKLPPSGSFTQFIKNDVLISNIRPYLKKVWQAQMDGSASNDVIVIRAKNKVVDNFLMYILKNDVFINYVMKDAKGVKMPRGDISSIKKYPLCLTSNKEQQKIANCLSSIDDLITAQAQKTEALKAHKKGLMQQLFPSSDEAGA